MPDLPATDPDELADVLWDTHSAAGNSRRLARRMPDAGGASGVAPTAPVITAPPSSKAWPLQYG